MTITQAEVITTLARNNMNTTAAGRDLKMHRNTVYYHMDMIQSDTGLNPLNFFELNELLKKANAVLEGENEC